MKIAVYVEGQTELIFTREFLLKWYGYDSSLVGIECFELRSSQQHPTEYKFLIGNPQRCYTIVNVGGDAKALSKALDNAERHRNLGFERVIVLRDMYSEQYTKAQRGQKVDTGLNNRFISLAQKAIRDKKFEGFVSCQFAIMEIEAWLLGMGWYLEKVDESLTYDYLLNVLKFDLAADPEKSEYHPARRLTTIYDKVGQSYDKHAGEVNSIMGYLDKSDFERLLTLNKCASFNAFVAKLTC